MSIFKGLLQDEDFLVAAGLLQQGAQGKSVGEGLFTSISQAGQLKKLFGDKKKERKIIKGADGFQYYADTGDRVLPNVEKSLNDKERKIIKGADGYQYYADTKERVFPDVVKEKKEPMITINNPYEKQYDKDRGTQDAKYIGDLNDKANTAQEHMTRYELVNALSKNVNSGAFGEQLLALAKFGKRLKINTDWITKTDENGNIGLRDGIASAETMEVLQVQFTLDKTQRTKGAISDREFQTFSQTSPGLSMTSEGIQMLTTVNKALSQRDVEVAELANQWEADYGRLRNKGQTEYGEMSFQQFLSKWKEDNPVVTEEFLKDMQEVSSQGSSLYEEKAVYTIGGVQYRKLKDGTVIRIGAL